MSAQIVTEPIPQFHNRDGQPLDGGFIFVGTAGLDAQSNPIPIYLDPALTVPLAQPVQTLNGYPSNGGTPVAFYAAVGNFSIKIVDAQGLLVLSAPNVTTRLDASNLTGSISAALVSFIQAGTGAVSRSVESKLQDSVSVFDFMSAAQIAAVKASTFLVDVTAPINAAIASGAREVFFPQGGYLVANDGVPANPAILLPSLTTGVALRGASRQATVIRNTGNGCAIASIGNVIIPNTSITISDMSIEGQVGTLAGVLLRYTSQAVLERLDVTGHGTDGIAFEYGAHLSVRDCWSRVNAGSGLYVGPEGYFVTVEGGTYETNDFGLSVGGATLPRYVTATGVAFRGNTSHNVSLGNCADVFLFGCSLTASNATLRHISIDGGAGLASGVTIEGCSLVGVNGAASTVGLYAAKCEDVTLATSVVDCTTAAAYDIAASAGQTQLVENGLFAGTRTNASTSTIIRELNGTTSKHTFGAGPLQYDLDSLPSAFRFRSVTAGGSTFPVFELAGWRMWANPGLGNLMWKGSDPATITDGYVLGPGLRTFTVGTLPAGAPDGTMAIVVDNNVLPVWGAIPAGGGGFTCAVIKFAAGWSIIGR